MGHPETRAYLTANERKINYVRDIANSIDSRIDYINKEIERVKKEGHPGNERVIENLKQYRDHDLPIRQKAYQDLIITPPNLTVEDKLTIYSGDRVIEVMHPGDGDTAGDLWVYLPNEQIICSGDAVVAPITYGFSKQGGDWLETLKLVEQMDIKTLIPGHGEVKSGKEYLRLYIGLLDEVYTQVSLGKAAGLTKEEVIESVNISGMEEIFTAGDPIKRYYFSAYFKMPYFGRLYDAIENE